MIDDVRTQARKVDLVDIFVYADLGRENEPAAIGIVERPHWLVKLVALGVPRDEDSTVVRLTDLDRGEDVPNRRPSKLLDGLFRASHEVKDTVEVRLPRRTCSTRR